MNDDQRPGRSHLFTVRVWTEELDHGQLEWRGQAQHVLSGESRYFRAWPTLIAFLQAAWPDDEAASRSETATTDSL